MHVVVKQRYKIKKISDSLCQLLLFHENYNLIVGVCNTACYKVNELIQE